MRLAWFTPFGVHSAIGEVSAILVEELRQQGHDVVIFADGVKSGESLHPTQAPVALLSTQPMSTTLGQLQGFEMVLYNLGDHLQNHRYTYEVSQAYPGIIILHDLVMTHFFFEYFVNLKREPDQLWQALEVVHGAAGADFVRRAIAANAASFWSSPETLEMNLARLAIKGVYGVVSHSLYSTEQLEKFAAAPVRYIPFPSPRVTLPPRSDQSSNRVQLLTFGVVNPNKLVHLVIDAISQSPLLKNRVHYNIIGSPDKDYRVELQQQIRDVGLEKIITLHGYQSDDVLRQALADTDIVFALRNPHFGESSWSLLESLTAGKPTVVWNHGYYATFPDEVVAKVEDTYTLRTTLEQLVQNRTARERLGQAAANHVAQQFSTTNSAQQFVEFIEETQYNVPVLRILDALMAEMTLMGADQHFPKMQDLIADELYRLASDSGRR